MKTQRTITPEEAIMTAMRLLVELDHNYKQAIEMCVINVDTLPESEYELWWKVSEVIVQFAKFPVPPEPSKEEL